MILFFEFLSFSAIQLKFKKAIQGRGVWRKKKSKATPRPRVTVGVDKKKGRRL
jgi:hypothetical protein